MKVLFRTFILCLLATNLYAQVPHLKPGMHIKFEHVLTIGSKGAGLGQFQYVEDFAWSSEEHLLVTDAVNANVQVFDKTNGDLLKHFGGTGVEEGKFEKPEGIAVDPEGNIFVADYSSGYIQKFDKNYSHIKTFADFGTAAGENMESEFMDIAHGRLYMADAGNSQVDVFDLEGNFLFEFGGEGSVPGQLNRPEAAKVDSAGNIWVCDLGNNRIQKFDKEGKFLNTWGKEGSAAGEFRKPTGLALDAYDNVYVGEVHNDRVQVFDKDFNFITMWGKFGSKTSEFGNIHGVIVDHTTGWVYVADTANNRVQVFKPVVEK